MPAPRRPASRSPAPPGAETVVSAPAPERGADSVCDAIAALRSPEEARRFLRDLTTPSELAALEERWRIARLLDRGGHSYRDIAAELGASTTTVARVARFLNDEPHQGYRLMLDRLHPRRGVAPNR